MESVSFRTAIIESNHVRGKLSWTDFIRRSKAPELPVVLLEDFAALIGLFLALIGVSMTLITDNGYWDAAGTACIGVLLVLVAITLAVETKSLLLGEAAGEDHREAIRAAALGADGADDVIHMRTLHVGPDEILVAIKLAVMPTESAQQVAEAINEAETRIRAAVPQAKFIFIEPDIRRAGTSNPSGLPDGAH
jgi:divalent metal cation (Fe/Co/Zn/Cd) transporter